MQQILKIGDHKDQPVTALCWNLTSDRVYSGDEVGSVFGTAVGEKVDISSLFFLSSLADPP